MAAPVTRRLEAYLERFAVTGLGYYLVFGQVAVWMLGLFRPNFPGLLQLDFTKIFESHEWWRLVTFVLAPPLPGKPFVGAHLCMIFGWLIFGMMTASLEGLWGKLRLNLYLLLCAASVALGAYLCQAELAAPVIDGLPSELAESLAEFSRVISQLLASAAAKFMFVAVFFSFAFRFPDEVFRIMFVFPVKVSWIARAMFAFLVSHALTDGFLWKFYLLILLPFFVANHRVLWERHLAYRLRRRHQLLHPVEPEPPPGQTASAEDVFEWYYEDNEEPKGPVSTDRIKSLLHGSEISPATKVWRTGMEDWEPLLNRPEFASVLPGKKG